MMYNVKGEPTKTLVRGNDFGYKIHDQKSTDPNRNKQIYVDLDLEAYKGLNGLIKEGEEEDEPIHWFYGDLQSKINKARQRKHDLQELEFHETCKNPSAIHNNIDPLDINECELTSHDLNSMKVKGNLQQIKDDKKHDKRTPGEKWRQLNARAETADGYSTALKFLMVTIVTFMYMAQKYGFLHRWENTCRNDQALHYWKCMENTKECHKLFLNQNANVYYCTKKDFELNNGKFCSTGYCDKDKVCQDDEFQVRVHRFATVFKNCLFEQEERGNACPNALSPGENPYDECIFGVQIFLFVFLVKDLFIDLIMNQTLEPKFIESSPACFTFAKMLTIIGVIIFWGLFIMARNPASEDFLDFQYVILFVGSTQVLDVFKLFRRDKLDPDVNLAEKHKNLDQEQCQAKWRRLSSKWSILTKAFFIPIWTASILVIISIQPTDVKNIIYFALQPFDELFADVATTDFVFILNGIMINTHKKAFKYRSLVNMIFKLTTLMTLSSMFVQLCLIAKFTQDIIEGKQFMSNPSSIYPSIVGDIVIICFFLFDFISNIFRLRAAWFLSTHSYLIACDVKCDLDVIEPIERRVAFKHLLGKSVKSCGVVNPLLVSFNLEFRKIAKCSKEIREEVEEESED